jgi:hypothetical protein
MQVVLLAAALDNTWLMPGSYHGRAMSQVERLLLVNNSSDALLKRYHRLYGRRAPQEALGYTGLSSWCVERGQWRKVSQVDACSLLGREHTFVNYLCAPGLMARMRGVLISSVPAVTAQAPEKLAVAGQAAKETSE